MKNKILEIRRSMSKEYFVLFKLDILSSIVENKDIVLLACGPFLAEQSSEKIKDFCKDKIVVCIKQAYITYKDQCHIHFYNDNNLMEYKHGEDIVIFGSSPTPHNILKESLWKNLREVDIKYDIVSTDFEKTIAATNDFESQEIQKTLEKRPWGSGIILESVFPSLVYMKPKRIYTLGWDYGPIDQKPWSHLEHFYTPEKRKYFLNPAAVCYSNENEKLVLNSKHLNDYLETKNIELFVLSKKSYVSEEIKRIEI
jgi:hypothetical protein